MAQDSSEAIIEIVGVIGWAVEYEKVRQIIRSIPTTCKRVTFEIFSPGGDVWEGNGIIQEIGELGKRAETVARVQVAASMATLICVACQKRSIAGNGRFLVHNAWSSAIGDAAEMEKMAKTLRDCEQEAAKFYAQQTGKTADEMIALMAEERWMMPDETKALGFVHEVCDPFKPEEYEAVKQEIIAAGKWPKALVELPPTETKLEDKSNGSQTDANAGNIPAVEQGKPDVPADVSAVKTYEQGLAEGDQKHTALLAKLQDLTDTHNVELNKVKAEMATGFNKRDEQIREHQSAKDTAIAKGKADCEAYEKRLSAQAQSFTATIEDLRKSLSDANERLAKLLGGSMTFSPASFETWEEALASCGGDYEKAAKEHDADRRLRNTYNKRNQYGKKA